MRSAGLPCVCGMSTEASPTGLRQLVESTTVNNVPLVEYVSGITVNDTEGRVIMKGTDVVAFLTNLSAMLEQPPGGG